MKIQIIVFLMMAYVSSNVIASGVNSEEKMYIGGYTNETHETVSRIVLLDDNTFCYKFMGGALDILAAGKWQLNEDKKGIKLQEVRLNSDAFPNVSDKRLDEDGLINIVFDGYSMSNAIDAVFMVSETEIAPKKFRPLFQKDQDTWKSEYVLPSLNVGQAKYFFIGFVEVDQYQQPVRLRVFQYKFENVQSLRIGFNLQAVNPLMNISATIKNDVLKVDGNNFGKKDILTKDIFEEVRQVCIYPVLQPEKVANNNNNDDEEMNFQPIPESSLKPIKEFTVGLNAIDGSPYEFVKEDINRFKFDSWEYLDSEYKKAFDNKNDLENYLSVSAGLVKTQENIKTHVLDLVSYANNLFNKYSQGEHKETGAKIINHFIDKIYPFIKEYRADDEINKSIEVLTSNALGTASSLKNESLLKKIKEKLLGPNFDIHTVKHGTLLYNLACDYALKKDKAKMLDAIKLAIANGKKPESFKADSDFSAYYQDSDFLNALAVAK